MRDCLSCLLSLLPSSHIHKLSQASGVVVFADFVLPNSNHLNIFFTHNVRRQKRCGLVRNGVVGTHCGGVCLCDAEEVKGLAKLNALQRGALSCLHISYEIIPQ